MPSSLDGPLCSPGGYATTHTLDIQHALGEALAHERFGQELVVLVKVRNLTGIDKLYGVKVALCGLGTYPALLRI